jgi:acyl carrier protein
MASSDVVAGRVGRGGVGLLDPRTALALLATLDGCVAVADIDWEKFVPAATAIRASRFWDEIAPAGSVREQVGHLGQPAGTLRDRLSGVPRAIGRAFVVDAIRSGVAAVLGFADAAGIAEAAAFRDLGFDSLTAVEFRNALGLATGLKLPSTLVFDYPNTGALADHIVGELVDDSADAETELSRLEANLLALPEGAAARMGLVARLRQLAKRLEPGESGAGDLSARIEAASTDDIFALIDNEIGIR